MPKASVANVSTTTPPAFELIPLAEVRPSPLNPRKRFDPEKHAEIVASVKAKGVIVPVMVRAVTDGGYELVYGERRYRAAKEAGLTHLPAIVRAIEDRELLELAITENVERNDMTPLEEGGAYKQLHAMGRSVEEIAALVGRTKATIYGRMKLAELEGKARTAVEKGELLPTIGVLIARLPTREMQDEAFELLCKESPEWNGGLQALTYDAAEDVLQEQFSLKLKDAPFDPEDAELVSGCGACTGCPTRTGAQPDLYPDVKHDTCLNRACYQSKVRAHAQKVKVEIAAKASKKGLEVLPVSALKSKEYVDLEKEVWDYGGRGQTKVKALLGKHAPEPAAIVVDGEGRAHLLVRAKDARKALKQAGKQKLVSQVAPEPQSSSGGYDWKAEEEKRKREVAIREAVVKRANALLLEAVKQEQLGEGFLRMLASILSVNPWEAKQALSACGLKREKIPKLKNQDLLTAVLFLAIGGQYLHEGYRTACKEYGIDLQKLDAEERQKAKDAEKAAAAAEKKPAPAKAKAKKGRVA